MAWADRFHDGRIALLILEGRLDRSDLSNLASRLDGLTARGMQEVVVDARGVEHWDFRGLPLVADTVEGCAKRGCAVAVVTPNSYLRDIAKAVGVFERFVFYDDMDLTVETPHEFTLVQPPPKLPTESQQVT